MRLVGIKSIEVYVSRRYEAILDWVNRYDFPARKVGGIWEAESDDIDVWRKGGRSQIAGGVEARLTALSGRVEELEQQVAEMKKKKSAKTW